MKLERERPKDIHNRDIEIIGTGSIGEEAGQLAKKTPALKNLGFNVPRRTVFAGGFFERFFQRNGLGINLREAKVFPDAEQRIRNGTFSENDFKILQRITASYGDCPLVIRSSAEGDARGTGIYKSVFKENIMGEVRKGIQEVVASYYSPDAIAFRRDAKTGEGFGIIIEPLIGQEIGDEYRKVFAPVLSGYGYTSTSREEGYINAVPGIGGGVDSRYGEKLTRKALEPYHGELTSYVEEQVNPMVQRKQPIRKSALLRTTNILGYGDNYDMKAYIASDRNLKGRVDNSSIAFDRKLNLAFRQVNLNPFFDKMQIMEQSFGKPQYFEWAMTLENGQPQYWIIQIADVNKKLDQFDFGNFGKPLLEAHTVIGSGKIESDTIIACFEPKEIDRLADFNKYHKGYVLFYPTDLASGADRVFREVRTERDLTYADINNASVLIEINNAQHLFGPLDHFQGQLDMTGKLFGITEFYSQDQKTRNDFWKGAVDKNGIVIMNKKVTIVGSEKQNRLVIYEKNE